MLLKPYGETKGRGVGGVLRLQSSGNDLITTLKTDCLPANAYAGNEEGYSLYLFKESGKEVFAGTLTQGSLETRLHGEHLDAIIGAAVVEDASLAFCLRSSGPDWYRIIEKFKMSRTTEITPPPPEPSASEPEAIHKIEKPAAVEDNSVYQTKIDESTEDSGYEDSGCDICPHMVRQTKINPFPSMFPGSEWTKISCPGPAGWWHYISGRLYRGGKVTTKIIGVPGEYGMTPPIWLEGFGTYLRCVTGDARGYWLMFQDAETGEVRDMGLSRHGG